MTDVLLLIMYLLIGFFVAKLHSGRRSCLSFYTKNKGRTWWFAGSEFMASKFTDQLQNFYWKRVRFQVPNKKEFYDN